MPFGTHLAIHPRLVEHPPDGLEHDVIPQALEQLGIPGALELEDALPYHGRREALLVRGVQEEAGP